MPGTGRTRAILAANGQVLVEHPDGGYHYAAGETDWPRLDALGEAEILAAASPDDTAHDPSFWDRATPVHPRRQESVVMRLDTDVLDWFRCGGEGYQTRINAVLRGYVEHERGRG